MEKQENVSRRSMLQTTGAGVGAILAGLQVADAEAKCGSCGSKDARRFPRAKFHHVGIPTQVKHKNERYLAGGKVYITNPDDHPYHIEWCRWLPESKDPKLLRTTVHLAFEVDCVEKELAKYTDKEIYLKPFVPFEGVKVAFILHEGHLIEFLEKTGKA